MRTEAISRSSSSLADSSPEVLHRYLGNGMEVFLAESRFAPLSSLQVWVKAGSIDEEETEAGVAHVLEHMLFKGTPRFPESGGIAGMVEHAGGDMNAYTTFDHTVYYLTAPSDFTEAGTDLLLDIVRNSTIEAGELARELEVIREEIRRGRDNPSRIVSQNLFSRLYSGTRFERPVIGFEEVVEKFTRESVRAFYERWYVPNNMIFVAAGDFDKNVLFARLQELSKDFAPKSVPARVRPPAPSMHEVLRKEAGSPVSLVRGPYQEVRFQLALRAPCLEDNTLAPWEMFASILGHGDTSRLARNVRDERQLVLGIDSDVYSPRYPAGMFSLGFYGKALTAEDAVRASLREISELAHVGPQSEEMVRVLNTVKAERVYGRESVEGVARTAGHSLLTAAKLNFEDLWIANLAKVTAAQVKDVAGQVLRALERGEFALSIATAREAREDWSAEALRALVKSAVAAGHDARERAVAAGGAQGALPYTERQSESNAGVRQRVYALPGGRELHFNWRENPRLPLVSLSVTWRAGQGLETEGKAGIGTFVSQMLTRGTKKQSYKSFVTELEDRASSVAAFSSRDVFGIRMDALEENAERTLEMLLDALFRPSFEPEEFSKVQSETQDVLVAQKDSPGARLSSLSAPILYGAHPYAYPAFGTEASVAAITQDDVESHWRHVLSCTKTFVVSCAGRFDVEAVSAAVYEEFAAFCEDEPLLADATLPLGSIGSAGAAGTTATGGASTPRFPRLADTRVGFSEFEREQAHISVGFRALTLSDPRRTALELGANILGGQGGRLFLDLRDKKSLAYSVGASQSPGVQAGVFSTYIGTASAKAREAAAGLKEHIERLALEPVTDDELARAKASVIGGQAMDAQHLHTQASQLAMSDVYGLGFDNFLRFSERVKAVRAEDIRAVMEELLAANPPVVSVVGPQGTWVPAADDPVLSWNLTRSATATAAAPADEHPARETFAIQPDPLNQLFSEA